MTKKNKKWAGMYPDTERRADFPMVNPSERAAAQPGVPEGWPWKGAWPSDKWYYFCGGWIDRGDIDAAFKGWKRGDPIGYVRDEAPEFARPGYEGERYEAMVPDTLDLQERAALGVNCLTEQTDPDADHEIYANFCFSSHPPILTHCSASRLLPKWMEALATCRLVSGSRQNEHVEEKWLERMLRMQGPDGLIYWPMKGRPWHRATECMGWDIPGDQGSCPFDIGRFLVVATAYYQLTGDEVWLETGKRIVDGLRGIAVDEDDYAYHPKWYFALGERATPDMVNDPRYVPHYHAAGWVLEGMGKFYRASGYEPARELGEKLTRYLMRRLPTGENRHFHTNTNSVVGILELSLATGNREHAEFAREQYERLKAWGDQVLGFFPEVVGPLTDYRGAETCEVSGMIIAALKLTEAGVGDLWDEADRWVRNQFAEAQLRYADWIERYEMRGYMPGLPGSQASIIDERLMATERVAERVVGNFSSWARPNDWTDGQALGAVGCCTGNGNRTWYHIWQNILHHDNGKLRVNLLLNRGSKWADVDSHIPYRGQVDIKVKQPVDLSIRIPEWAAPAGTRVRVNGEERRVTWDGRYAQAGGVKPGDVATMTFPISERVTRRWIQGQSYELVLKGSDVVCIEPPGQIHPLYQRRHYRANDTRWRKTERFVPGKVIQW